MVLSAQNSGWRVEKGGHEICIFCIYGSVGYRYAGKQQRAWLKLAGDTCWTKAGMGLQAEHHVTKLAV